MKSTFDYLHEALDYADNKPDWRVTNKYGMTPVAFDVHTETFYHLVRRGGFILDPYFVWEEQK